MQQVQDWAQEVPAVRRALLPQVPQSFGVANVAGHVQAVHKEAAAEEPEDGIQERNQVSVLVLEILTSDSEFRFHLLAVRGHGAVVPHGA